MAIRAMFSALAVPALLCVAAPPVLSGLSAQDTPPAQPGRIAGRVLATGTGEPIPGAQIVVIGAGLSARADLSGRYALLSVPAGTYTLTVRMIGYGEKAVTGVVVAPGGAVPLDVTLEPAAIEVAAVEVTAAVERGSVARALDEQRNSNQIVNAVSAEQISRSPDSDAGQAVKRVSGVTVQDGKYVLVRGLGERYTTTSLNGARVPSPEPERKIVPLDLFPSGLLDGITTAKTFTPDQPGDFTGAQVNLRTRDFPLNRVWTFSTAAGVNDAIVGATLPFAPTEGTEWLGVAGDARTIPTVAAEAGTLAGTNQQDWNTIIKSFRNVWTSDLRDGGGKASFAASLGGSDPIAGRPFEYLASLTYSYETEARVDERRAVAEPGVTPGTYDQRNAYHGATGRTSVLWGGLLNLGALLSQTSRLTFSNTYTRGGDNEAMRMAGFNNDFDQNLDLTRLTFTERHVRSHQLRGEHLVAGRHGLDWQASASAVRRYEPDRADLAYQTTIDSATGRSRPAAWFGASQSATRTFNDLEERGYEGSVNYRHVLGAGGRALKVGALFKTADREADTRAYDIINLLLTDTERAQQAEAIFNGTYADQSKFFLAANAALGKYSAADRLLAGYVQLELPLGPRWRMVGGARIERDRLEVRSSTLDLGDTVSVLDNTDVLPALGVTFSPSERHNIRFSLSQTLSRPEYREISPTPSFEPLGGQSQRGNPDLQRALIQNADVRWEWYPTPGQIISAGVFAKIFHDPIERILVQRSSGNEPEVTWVNANGADNYGLELELRTNLGALGPALFPVTVFANTTLMQSTIEPGNDSLSSLTSARRPMVGQAEYVVNAGLTYGGALSATLLYNVVGPRIREAAIYPLPDVIEHERHVLDLSVQAPLASHTTLKLDARNLLDAPVLFTQGSVERHHFRTGRVFTLGLTWTP